MRRKKYCVKKNTIRRRIIQSPNKVRIVSEKRIAFFKGHVYNSSTGLTVTLKFKRMSVCGYNS